MTDERFTEIFDAIERVRPTGDPLKDVLFPDDDLVYELFDEICRLRSNENALKARIESEKNDRR